MISPITLSSRVEVFYTYSSNDIIALYKKDFGMDVSHYFKDHPEVILYRCKDTGLRFFYPASLAGDGKFYAELQHSNNYYNEWRWDHQFAAGYIPEKSKMLEIGCGTGSFMEEMTKRNVVCTGLELNPEAVQSAKAKDLNVHASLIDAFSTEHPEQYSVVCAFQVLEHIADVRNFVCGAVAALQKEGRLIMSVPYNHPFLYGYDIMHTLNLPPHHMGLWDEHSLIALGNQFQLKIEKISIEPLKHYRYYFQVKFNKRFGKNIFSTLLTSLVTPFAKTIWAPFMKNIPGQNVIVVYKKS